MDEGFGDKVAAAASMGGGKPSGEVGAGTPKDPRKTNRTTRMLLAVVVLFLLTELPHGVLHLLSGALPASFFFEVSASKCS